MNNSIWQDLFSSSSPEERAILVVEHFINTLPKEIALVVRRCIILHWFDEEIVKALLQDFSPSQRKARGIYVQIQSFPFIDTLPWGLSFNDSTREGLLRRYSGNEPELLRTAARYAAPAYRAHKHDRMIAAEAFFCYVVAGDITSAVELFKTLLKKALYEEDWEYVRGLQRTLTEAQKLPFVIQSSLLPTTLQEYQSFARQLVLESTGDNETEIPINHVVGHATKRSTPSASRNRSNKASSSEIKSDQEDLWRSQDSINQPNVVVAKPYVPVSTDTSEPQKASKKEEPNNGAEQPHYTFLGLSWKQVVVIGSLLITVGILLGILGFVFTSLSSAVLITGFLFGGVGVLIMFLQLMVAVIPFYRKEIATLRKASPIQVFTLSLRQNRRVQIGTIILTVVLIAGILLVALQPHNARPTSSHLSSIPYPPNKGILVLNDTLNEKTSDSHWDEDSNCSFPGNAYHISANDGFYPCFDENTNFSDFAFQVEMVFLTSDNSSNGAGIIFRADKANSFYYGFFISEVGNGELFISTSSGIENRLILKKEIISSFEYGNNQINLIAVVAQGEDIQVYVNKILFADVVDDHYSHGSIGVFAQNDQSSFTSTEVEFTNAKVWTL